jgi:CO dehydrogenase maturation factor
MSFVLAVAGKGGTGKTTLAGLTIRYLSEKRGKPVLAVDADSNSCLNEALGLEVHETIGSMREESLETIRGGADRPGGMSAEQLFDYRVQQSIVEAKGFDLLVMGRPEGPGCYCAANNIIRKYSDKLSEEYSYVVIDNEAGMEHLSRRTTRKIDIMFAVSDPTKKGLMTAERINNLVDELKLEVDQRVLVVNRITDDLFGKLSDTAEKLPFDGVWKIPNDPEVSRFDLIGKPVFELPSDSVAVQSVFALLDSLRLP